jgi:cytoskeletal protein RodZ
MTGKIFINYRRGDDPGHTGRLFDRLQDEFQPQELFLDVDNIPPGRDFVRELNDRVAECDIVLSVIGKTWLDAQDGAGARRLDNPDDFVRIELVSALDQGKQVIPVLVGETQMPRPEDLPEPLRPLARRNAMRLTHERFRADMAGLIKALRQSLDEIEAQRQTEERRRQDAAAKERAEEEKRAFSLAKLAGTIAALEAFLALNPVEPLADEARKLKAGLLARKEAYRRASESDDPALLRSFLATYAKGGDVDQVRTRLRTLKLQQGRQPGSAIIISSALAVMLIAVVALVWFEIKAWPPAAPQQASVASTPALVPSSASTAVTQAAGDSSAAANTATGPSPDEVAWMLLRDTSDVAALKRFTEQFPNSPLREDAAARITDLNAAGAAKAAAAARAAASLKAQAAQQAEAAARLEAANKELAAERARLAAQAQQPSNPQVALATPSDAGQADMAPLSGSALTQQIEMELMRVGCYAGQIDGNWSSSQVKLSVAKFVKAASLTKTPDQPTSDFLNSIRGQSSRICPLECAKTETASNGQCLAKTCPQGEKLNSDGDCEGVKERTASRPAPSDVNTASPPAEPNAARRAHPLAPSSATEAQAAGIGISCGRFGCKTHAAHPAPGGLPCRQAWQDRGGAWHCS